MRKLVNAVEADIALAVKVGSSRAYGTEGTAPFGTVNVLTDFAQIAKILDDNGAPMEDRQLVLNSAAIANLRGVQASLFKVNEAGSADMLREGMTSRIQNMAIRYSGGIVAHTVGTANGAYAVNLLAGYAVGDTAIAIDTGAGTILAGDTVKFAGDDNEYVVGTALSGGVVTLNKPGLRETLADGVILTPGTAYTGNYAFSRDAVVLAARAPAVPSGGDSADDAMTITDPLTGMTFEVRVYRQYRQVKFEVCLAWGCKVVKSEHVATLFG
jgi:hypothetical protein